MTRLHTDHRRRAFTIVEMLVAAALIMFMMWIIAAAFQAGLESFRTLKTAGDMQEKLRAASTAIRRDLTRPHFDDGNTSNEDLGNQRFDITSPPWPPPLQGYFRIFQGTDADLGFLEGYDADDPTSTLAHKRVPSTVNSQGHVLQFTVRLRGVRRDQYFLVDTRDGDVPPGADGPLHQLSFPVYNRRILRNEMLPGGTTNPFEPRSTTDPKSSMFTTIWGEVTYFVRPNGTDTGGIPLYNLYRRQNLLVTDNGTLLPPLPVVNPTANNGEYLQIGSWAASTPQAYVINSQKTVTAPIRRFGVQNTPEARYQNPILRYEDQAPAFGNPNHPLAGADLMLTDVSNFAVKVLWEPSGATGAMTPPMPDANPDYPFDNLPPITGTNPSLANQRIFDTWSQLIDAPGGTPAADDYGSTRPSSGSEPGWNSGYATGSAFLPQSIPLKIRVRGIQIEMRIWDVKSKQTRQVTIIQDM
jgi:hypothetical protein